MSDGWPSIVVVDAQSNLGLMPPAPGREPGVKRMPAALRATGLVARLGAADGGRVEPPPYVAQRDPGTGMRNADAIRAYSIALADKLAPIVGEKRFALLLGGDCSILIGSMLALRRVGRYGLVFIDGHTDFQTPATSATGGVAGMDLALVTGRGPALLADIDEKGPLVQDDDVIVFAHRDVDDPATYYAKEIFDTAIRRYDLADVRRLGAALAAEEVLAHLDERKIDGFWIHLDADVLDSAVMPAVDSPQPDGLSFAELTGALTTLLRSDLAVGMQITIFDPDLDPDGQLARDFAAAIATAFYGATSSRGKEAS